MSLRLLAKDTAIYGLSSIVGRFLNWLLVPLYTYTLTNAAEYGIVTNLYSWLALLMVLLTYGMETTFFRYANKEGANPQTVFSTAFLSIAASTLIFCAGALFFLRPIGEALQYNGHSELIVLIMVILALDLLMAIPFCYLRFLSRPIRFASLKLLFIAINIGLNLFFLLVMPRIVEGTQWEERLLQPGWEIKSIIVSNLIGNVVLFFALLPTILSVSLRFDFTLWKQMMRYTYPLLILGLAGMLNQTADKILLPLLVDNKQEALSMLGIYGANFKIAVVMVMFAQAFRFAYEPYFFAQGKQKGEDNRIMLANAMKYFIIFALFIYLGVMGYLDILKYFIGPTYYEGLKIVPIVMITELLFGIFFNLSVWYKLTDKTQWGAYFSIAGAIITIGLNILFIPKYGYWACAWVGLISYLVMTIASYITGKKYYPIPYRFKKTIGAYLLFTAIASIVLIGSSGLPSWVRIVEGTLFLVVYLLMVYRKEWKHLQRR